jgi:hypothetical protein
VREFLNSDSMRNALGECATESLRHKGAHTGKQNSTHQEDGNAYVSDTIHGLIKQLIANIGHLG